MKIRKGDRVRVLTGKFRGKEGEVMTVLPKDNKVIIDGINVAKRHQKPTRAMQQGGIIDKAMPIDASNVALIDSDGKVTYADVAAIGKLINGTYKMAIPLTPQNEWANYTNTGASATVIDANDYWQCAFVRAGQRPLKYYETNED